MGGCQYSHTMTMKRLPDNDNTSQGQSRSPSKRNRIIKNKHEQSQKSQSMGSEPNIGKKDFDQSPPIREEKAKITHLYAQNISTINIDVPHSLVASTLEPISHTTPR